MEGCKDPDAEITKMTMRCIDKNTWESQKTKKQKKPDPTEDPDETFEI